MEPSRAGPQRDPAPPPRARGLAGPASPRAVTAAFSVAALAAALALGCDSGPARGGAGGPDAGARLAPEQAGQVLVQVGPRPIALGDYAAALERMDPLERMRYQTEDRRQALLDEMIHVELLAREAERRGLDRRPETIALVRQLQRDEVLARLRRELPRPEALPAAEVSRHYQEHRAAFREPAKRRAAQIVVDDVASARELVRAARGAGDERWAELARERSPGAASGEAAPADPPVPELGPVAEAPDESERSGPELPAPLREALFRIASVGDVYPEPVEHAGRYHVLRLLEVIPERQRSLSEVDELIRSRLLEERRAQARAELLDRLRAQTAVRVESRADEPAPTGP